MSGHPYRDEAAQPDVTAQAIFEDAVPKSCPQCGAALQEERRCFGDYNWPLVRRYVCGGGRAWNRDRLREERHYDCPRAPDVLAARRQAQQLIIALREVLRGSEADKNLKLELLCAFAEKLHAIDQQATNIRYGTHRSDPGEGEYDYDALPDYLREDLAQ